MSLFQVLIGRLVTQGPGRLSGCLLEFQVLIGRLVTDEDSETEEEEVEEFQVLIGRLVTRCEIFMLLSPRTSFKSL